MRVRTLPVQILLLSAVVMMPVVGSQPGFAEGKRVCLQQSQPAYPEIARRMRIEGVITLLVSVEPDGHVSSARIESGHPMLGAAAQQAVMHWRFAPAAEAEVLPIRIDFKL